MRRATTSQCLTEKPVFWSKIRNKKHEIRNNDQNTNVPMIDGLVKSQISDDKIKSFRCKAHKYEGMRRTYWYAAMTEDAVQHSRWTFYEVVND